MYCPFCRNPDSRVVDSRIADDGSAIRRRRQCPECGRRFTTVETTSLTVIKRSGVGEPFSRSKVINGVRKACQGRPVTEDDLALLAQEVEEAIRAIRRRRNRGPRSRPGDPGSAAASRRGGLPALRQRLPGLRIPGGLRIRHCAAAPRGGVGTDAGSGRCGARTEEVQHQTPVVAAEGKPRPPPATNTTKEASEHSPGRLLRTARLAEPRGCALFGQLVLERDLEGRAHDARRRSCSSAGTIGVRSFSCGRYSSARLEMPPPTMNSSGENRNSTWEK